MLKFNDQTFSIHVIKKYSPFLSKFNKHSIIDISTIDNEDFLLNFVKMITTYDLYSPQLKEYFKTLFDTHNFANIEASTKILDRLRLIKHLKMLAFYYTIY